MAGQRGREGDILQYVWLGMGGVGTCDTTKNLTIFFLPFFYSLFLKKKKKIYKKVGRGITPTTVAVLESLVAKRVVSFSLESGYKKLVIKGDSELMIGALRCGGWKNSHVVISSMIFYSL